MKTAQSPKTFQSIGRIRPKQHIEKTVDVLARERVHRAYELFDHVAVQWSGGKDSTACLNMTIEVARELDRLPVEVFFFDEEAIPLQTEEFVRRTMQQPEVELHWLCLPIRCRNACSRKEQHWFPWAPEVEDKWVRPLPPEGITEWPGYFGDIPEKRLTHAEVSRLLYPSRPDSVCEILGIRADESLRRFTIVSNNRTDNYIVTAHPPKDKHEYQAMDPAYARTLWRGGFYRCYPIYDWSTEDDWLAAKQSNDYNRAYDVMEMAGVSHSAQRLGPPFGTEPMQKLWMYHVCFPELWEKMVDRVPGARTASRYATTELYSFGKLPEKPNDVTWEEYVRQTLMKWPTKTREQMADRIRLEIQRHYRHTRDPILHVPHPVTGTSWPAIWSLADRGDEYGRRVLSMSVSTKSEEQLQVIRATYEEALEEHKTGRRM